MGPQQEQHGAGICTLGPKRPATPGKPISPESPCVGSRTRWGERGRDKDARPLAQDLWACLLPGTSRLRLDEREELTSQTLAPPGLRGGGSPCPLSDEKAEAGSGIP